MADHDWLTKLLRNSVWVMVGLFLGRIAGFLRDIVLASRFGVGTEADIAILMLTLPDLLVNILVGGGLSVALIPAFKRYGAGPRSHCLFMQSSLIVAILFSVVALLLTNFTEPLVKLVAPGFGAQQVASTVPLLNIALWLIPLTILAGVTTAYLHANDRFAVAAFGTFTFNSVILMGLGYSIVADGSLHNLALFILSGGLLRWGFQLLAVPRQKPTWRCRRWRLIDYDLVRRYVHVMSAGGLLLVLPVAARAMASLHGDGGMSLFTYSMKLVEFPLGIGVMVLSVGLFPLLSQCFARNDANCGEMVATGIRIVLLIAISMMLPLTWYAADFSRLVFERGAMASPEVATIGTLLAIGVFALPFQAVASILTATYNASGNTAVILRLNFIAVVLFVFIGYFSVTRFGLSALMLSLVFVHGVLVFMQMLGLRSRLSLEVSELLLNKRLVIAISLMLLFGAGFLALLDYFKFDIHVNATFAVLIGAGMLLIGIVSGGMRRTMAELLTRRLNK